MADRIEGLRPLAPYAGIAPSERIYVALDLETTGLDPARDAIIEIGAVRFQGDRVLERFATFVNPQRSIPLRITQITGIRNADVAGAPSLDKVAPELLAFVGREVAAVVAHNAAFDIGFLRAAGINFHRPVYDTLDLAGMLLPGMASYSLGELAQALAIPLVDAHRALDDAQATAELFQQVDRCVRMLPPALLRLILDSARESEWPYLALFDDAAAVGDRQLPVPLPAAPVFTAEGLDGNEIARRVPVEALTALFAEGGPLAEMLGERFERRAGQSNMAEQVLRAFNAGDHLLIEAGTGTGKSLAYLLPAALWAVANGQRVVIATNTIALQDQLIEKDIPQVQALLARAGYPSPQGALLKGRQNYLCTRRLHTWRTSHRLNALEVTVLAKVLVWLTQTRTGDAGEIALFAPAEKAIWARICSDAATCSPERCEGRGVRGEAGQENPWLASRDFYLETRQRAEGAHLLVVNHALLLADLAAEGRVLPAYAHLIVDETHRLEEAATDQLTYRVEWPVVQATLRRLTHDGDLLAAIHRAAGDLHSSEVLDQLAPVAGAAGQAATALADFAGTLTHFARQQNDLRQDAGYAQRLALSGAVRSQPDWSQLEIEWDEVRKWLYTLVEATSLLVHRIDTARWWQRESLALLFNDLRSQRELLAELSRQLDEILLAPDGNRRDRVAWLEVTDNTRDVNGVTLAIAPLAVHEILERGLVHQRRCAIFTGATLRTGSSFRYLRERLGLWDVNMATVESPFDYKRSTLLYLPGDMPLPNQPNYQRMVEQAIVEAATAADGRTLVLFTSYQQLRTSADAIRAPLDRLGITVLAHGQSGRQRLLREYRKTPNAVLLGTRSFWEGIDLPGDELRCLLIARLPFAVPNDPLVAARSAEFEDPFQDYTVPDAVLRFRQGFGRLIRRATDRGVVVLLDSRIWRKDYGQTFLESLPECTLRRAPLGNLGGEIRTWLGERRDGQKR